MAQPGLEPGSPYPSIDLQRHSNDQSATVTNRRCTLVVVSARCISMYR